MPARVQATECLLILDAKRPTVTRYQIRAKDQATRGVPGLLANKMPVRRWFSRMCPIAWFTTRLERIS